MIDGPMNTVFQEDSIPLPMTEEENPYGNAWKVVKTPLVDAGYADASPQYNRCFKIVNEDILNPISQNPVGYKTTPHPSQLILASKGSVTRAQARFAEHHV